MPIPKEFLDIAWDGSSAREVLRLVIDRIKILANSEEPEKNFEVHEKFRHFVDHWRVANTVIRRDQLSKNVGEPAVLTATSARLVAGIHGQASDKAPPNTVEKKWPTRLSYLKRAAGTTTSAQLPTLWHELAKCKKHESIGIVQSLLDDEAEKLNLNLEFIVSARVIKSLVELEFCSRGDVEKGLNVFNSVCFQHYKNANAINDYNKSDYWLTGEKTTASMKDHQAHDKIKHAIFPKDPMQFREMVNSMRVFYRVVFGKTHPLTAVYKKFAKNVDSMHEKWECPNRSEHSSDFSSEFIPELIVTLRAW
ncbi:unnamed protein product [Cylindrotheca closterium]|uniref:Uncharacterized protein n=1 Tax=Cylindrotheca closterium TaxID=2856 RepID=A0AAD2FDW3_9STRA|nr:unnamed protein product [Cylindrotheca closterium]